MKKYKLYEISINEELYELAYAALSDLPFTGIEEKIDRLIISFDINDLYDSFDNELMILLNDIDKSIFINNITTINEENWNENWEKNVPAIKITDKIGVAPSWKIDELDTNIRIIINPKMSFGTGEHATTRLMLKIMEKAINPGENWIDAGTGTGLLAIAAIKLGANFVYAFDNDEWSFLNAKENILLNECANSIILEQHNADDLIVEKGKKYNGIMANLNLFAIKNSLSKFDNILKYKGNRLIISGILLYDSFYIIDILSSYGYDLIIDEREDEWVGLLFEKV